VITFFSRSTAVLASTACTRIARLAASLAPYRVALIGAGKISDWVAFLEHARPGSREPARGTAHPIRARQVRWRDAIETGCRRIACGIAELQQ
jgi:hypothetical protein